MAHQTSPKSPLLAALLAVLMLGGIAGCEDQGPMEEAGENIDEGIDEAGDEMDEAGDEMSDEF